MLPLRDANPAHARPYLTWALVAVNVAVFLYMSSIGNVFRLVDFVYDYGFVPQSFAEDPGGRFLSLFTSLFLHGSWSHLISNMVFLIVFGDNVEDRFGRLPYLVFYLLGGAAATLTHALFEGRSPVPLVGASGAISAVLGAYIAIFPRQQVQTFIPPLFLPWLLLSFFVRVPRFFLLWLPAWVFIGYWALIQLFEASATVGVQLDDGSVAWWAHVGGFAFGLLWTNLFRPKPRRYAPP
jgi:membrane associated rhomboid family serine protease